VTRGVEARELTTTLLLEGETERVDEGRGVGVTSTEEVPLTTARGLKRRACRPWWVASLEAASEASRATEILLTKCMVKK
jgi:hypothetical protein